MTVLDCEFTHLMQGGRSVGAVAPGRVAIRVESLVTLLTFLLLFRSHDMCLHPRAQFRPEHVAHGSVDYNETAPRRKRRVDSKNFFFFFFFFALLSQQNRPRVICASYSSAPFHTVKQYFCNKSDLLANDPSIFASDNNETNNRQSLNYSKVSLLIIIFKKFLRLF